MDKYAIVSGPEGDELIEAYQKPNKDMYFEFLSEACRVQQSEPEPAFGYG